MNRRDRVCQARAVPSGRKGMLLQGTTKAPAQASHQVDIYWYILVVVRIPSLIALRPIQTRPSSPSAMDQSCSFPSQQTAASQVLGTTELLEIILCFMVGRYDDDLGYWDNSGLFDLLHSQRVSRTWRHVIQNCRFVLYSL